MGEIDCILGTRPEAMKVLPVVHALREGGASVRVIFTSQHESMARGVFSAFGIAPDVILPSHAAGADMAERLSVMLHALGRVPTKGRCCIVVQGDTLSAFAGGIFGFLSRVPVVHLEAGLRSHDVFAPYPEEALRRALASFATLHLCPTPFAVQNLLSEGIPRARLRLIGNTVADALHTLLSGVSPYEKAEGRYLLLLTLHRRECDTPTRRAIFHAVRTLLDEFPCCELILPVHEHPSVRRDATEILGSHPRAKLLPPLAPTDFYSYLVSSDLVLTDSGGVQEEAALLGLQPLVLRERTEREEELYGGKLTLVGTAGERILEAARARLSLLLACAPSDGRARLARALSCTPNAAAGAREEILAFIKNGKPEREEP